MTDQHELGRVRSVGLSPYDIKVLNRLMETSGEFAFTVVADDTRALHIAGMASLAQRELITIDEARSTFNCWVIRLTDNGRAVCAQLEKMNVKPRVEVEMHGAAPVVVKP